MKVKLLFVTTALNKGGAEVALVNLLNNLDKNKYEIDLLITSQSDNDAISLLPKLSKHINICSSRTEDSKITALNKIIIRRLYKAEQIEKYGYSALKFINDKEYDLAFSYGEWFSPDFIAEIVHSKNKAVWIHNDLSKAEYFDAGNYFKFHSFFDYYIFVSEESKRESITKYCFLQSKSIVIKNMIDFNEVKELSIENVEDYDFKEPYTLITVANVRLQKNHLKALEVMKRLKEKGIKCKWINIGSLVDNELVDKIKNKTTEYNLEKDFLFLGPRDNPYKYIKKSYAVLVLSDYESWSLVITESKVLNIPVIATKTSGAIEQIQHLETGILTDFDVNKIIYHIENLLMDKCLYNEIVSNLKGFNPKDETLEEFEKLIESTKEFNKDLKQNIMFIMDNINYPGGGHIASKRFINYLVHKGKKVTAFSDVKPTLKTLITLGDINYITIESLKEQKIFNKRILDVLLSTNYSFNEKLLKLKMTIKSKFKSNTNSYISYVLPFLVKVFNHYDVVCVTSEGSKFRGYVAESISKKKFQWIHTDYFYWSSYSDYTRELTKNDEYIYCKFDKILFVSQKSKLGFDKKFPELSGKTEVIRNIIPENEILELSKRQRKPFKQVRIVTVARLEPEKAIDRIIDVVDCLVNEGYDLLWEIIGDGWQREELDNKIKSLSLGDNVKLLGAKSNPFIYLKSADLFALLSNYEGLPNTVFESLILGIPVIATDVGDVSTQIAHGENGWLIDNSKEAIINELKYLIENQDIINKLSNNLKNYRYDNQSIYNQLNRIFEL